MPGWLGGLVEESFFVGCGTHENRRKNEKNIFCLGCCTSICPHCVPAHPSHPLSRVRRYVYNDVVRLEDLEKLIDCSFVQPYTINSAKVVFLKPRPQSRPSKVAGNTCSTCDRILQEPFRFCSLSCKVLFLLVVKASCDDRFLSPPDAVVSAIVVPAAIVTGGIVCRSKPRRSEL
ncbi:PLATZ transcription factor [Musa troglodytarum]|uniref:PLATZ transcription factor n=1 Tax=Musa troglodytarum TaxID=320322 RepID=A0A9E7L7C1_9LILI|nr:PLATZ transcription factor [Musa troglodytarum]